MFIRFSSQESIDQTNSYTVRADNTAGTQRLADGSRIMGAIKGRDAIYVWTDTALFLMKFVGQPFTFSFEQVGTNCGLLGKNACVEVDGSAYWMSENGFFTCDGQLKSMPCLVDLYGQQALYLEQHGKTLLYSNDLMLPTMILAATALMMLLVIQTDVLYTINRKQGPIK